MQPQPTYSRALARFLADYPDRSGLDRRLLVEVFRNGRYRLFGGNTGLNFSGRGIALTIGSEADMREQLRDALNQLSAADWPQEWLPVEKFLGRRIERPSRNH